MEDTNRFTMDIDLPQVDQPGPESALPNARRHPSFTKFGVTVEMGETPILEHRDREPQMELGTDRIMDPPVRGPALISMAELLVGGTEAESLDPCLGSPLPGSLLRDLQDH